MAQLAYLVLQLFHNVLHALGLIQQHVLFALLVIMSVVPKSVPLALETV